MTQEGEILWERNIIDFNIIPPTEYTYSGNFTNLAELDNGDIMVIGSVRDRFDDGSFNTNIWLLRLDENGCFFPDCG